MRRKILISVLILSIGFSFGGCGILDKVQGNDVELTPRQCEILWSMDLPAEWSELTDRQKDSITAIEEMLDYLDEKYDKTFCYNGYIYPDKLYGDEETLLAYAEGDDPETQSFTVTRTEDGFEDGYDWVLEAPIVQKEMDEKISGILEGQTYKMFTEITGMGEDGKASSVSVQIYIENTSIEQCDKFFDSIVNDITEGKNIDDILMYCFDSGITCDMNEQNFKDCFSLDDIKIFYRSSIKTRENNNEKWYRR